MKFYRLFTLLLVSFTIVFTSCNRQNIDEIIEETIVVKDRVNNSLITRSNVDPEGNLDLECFTIDYPFQLLTINDNTIDIENEDDFEAALFDSIDYVIDFVYPLTLTYEDGETTTVTSLDELGEAFASCVPDEGWAEDAFPAYLIEDDNCISLVYPLQLVDFEDSIIIVSNETEFIELLATNEFLFFEFPLTVSDNESGEEYDVENEEEFFLALTSCEEVNQPCDSLVWNGQIACFDIVFPATLLLLDGSTESVEDADELTALLVQNEVENFQYPLNLVNTETGILLTVSNDEELVLALLSCSGIVVTNGIQVEFLLSANGTCFDIVFPVDVEDYYGTTTEVTSLQELETFVNQYAFVPFPFVVTLLDGSTVTLNSMIDFNEIIENC